MNKRFAIASAAALALAGCAGMGGRADDTATASASGDLSGAAVADLKTADGAAVGRATARMVNGAIKVSIEGMGLPPGPHGIHIHTTGRCDGPDFTTAGGHWNTTAMHHGTENPAGPHSGDMPNLMVGSDGRGSLSIDLPSGTMAQLLDADGSAIVIHASADDLKTDPAGNSGARIACGVFSAG